MTLEQLNEFCTVVKFQNITKAAEYLYVSQPTLSRHLAELEDSLGVQLLARDNNRAFVLTNAGKLLYEESSDILSRVTDMEQRVRRVGSGVCGNLTVSSLNIFYKPLFDAYRAFCVKYPDIVFTVHYKGAPFIASAVLQGEADIGLGFSFELPAQAHSLGTYKLMRDSFRAVVSRDHPLAGRGSITLPELRNEHFLYMDQVSSDFTERIAAEHSPDAMPLHSPTAVGSVESMLLQVRANLGITLLPYVVASEYSSGCSLLEISDFDTSFDLVLVWREPVTNPSLKLFLDMLEKK